jgi:hypothetical protein
LSDPAQVSHLVYQFFFVNSVCPFVRVCGGYKESCHLLFASHIGHNVIRKEEKKA